MTAGRVGQTAANLTELNSDLARRRELPYRSVTEWGVEMNPAFDESAAMQAALSSGYSALLVPPGTVRCKNLTIPDNTQLYLTRGAVLLMNATGTASLSRLLKLSPGAGLFGPGTIDGNIALQTQFHTLIESFGDDTFIGDVRFQNALARQIYLKEATRGHKVFRNWFLGNGGISAVVVASRNAIEAHCSSAVVAFNTFRDINQGHGVRVGRINGTEPEDVWYNVVAFNHFENILDPVNESPAMKAEVKSKYCEFIGNTVRNATRWLKMDSTGLAGSCSDHTVAFNKLKDILSQDGVNAATAERVHFLGNMLIDCGGGLNLGPWARAEGNHLENIGVGLEGVTLGGIRADTPSPDVSILNNYIKNAKRFPCAAFADRGRIRGNVIEACEGQNGGAIVRTGSSTPTTGGEISDNLVINPTWAAGAGTKIVLQGTGNYLTICRNKMLGGAGIANRGIDLFTSDFLIVKDNLGVATVAVTPVNIAGSVGVNRAIADNI